MVHPEDAVVIDPGSGKHRFLTEFNRERIKELDWQPPRHFWFTAKNGKRIHNLITYPPRFEPSKKYPLVVFPHGEEEG